MVVELRRCAKGVDVKWNGNAQDLYFVSIVLFDTLGVQASDLAAQISQAGIDAVSGIAV